MSLFKTTNISIINANSKKARRIYKGSTLVYVTKVQTTENKIFNAAGTYSFTLPKELLSLTITVVGGGGGGDSGLVKKVGTCSAGGGGGSSYTNPDLCTNVKHTQRFKSGDGYITISMV